MISKIKNLIFINGSSKQILLKNTFWLTLLEFISKLIMFFVTISLVRYLGPQMFGKYNIALSMVAVFMVFSDLGVGFNMTKDISKNKNISSLYLSNTLGIRVITTVFILLLSFFASKFMTQDQDLLLIFSLAIVHNIILQFQGLISNLLTAHEKMEYIFIIKTFYYLGLLFSTISLIFFNLSLPIIISAYCSVSFLSILISIILLSKLNIKVSLSFDFEFYKKIIIKSLPIFGFIACSQIYSNVDTLLIANYFDDQSVGIYQSAYKILFAFQSINIVNSVLFPRITSLMHENKISTLNKITKSVVLLSLVVLIPIALIISLNSAFLVKIIYSNLYIDASIILIFLIWSGVINYFRIMSTNFLMAKEKQNQIFYSMLIGLVANIILNIILLPKFGILVASINLLISELIILFFSLFFQKVYSK